MWAVSRVVALVCLAVGICQAVTAAAAEGGSADPQGVPVSLETALQWTLLGNPDLIALRQGLCVSAEAVEVARRFPTSLNPTVSVDESPWVFERAPGDGIQQLENFFTVSWAQPIEFGHRTAIREAIARASYSETRWKIVQAELLALVQTYRFHQGAAYRREKLRVAIELAEFNNRLVQTLGRQWEANQIPTADLLLAEVENHSANQLVETARQEYVAAISDLRQQFGTLPGAAWVEPVGEVKLPPAATAEEEGNLIQTALASRPEILAARATVEGSRAAVRLARADRIPIPSVGPAYEHSETGATFYGVAISSPIPLLNTGTPLLRQREAEYRRDVVALQQLQQRTRIQVQATLVRWRQAQRLVEQTNALTEPIKSETARMERLYAAGQTDLVKLFQVRQRLIEASNTQLDALWAAIQAYADLLTALGGTPLLGSLAGQAPADAPTAPLPQ